MSKKIGRLVGELTQQHLKGLLSYDPETGLFTWTANAPEKRVGRIAGHVAGGYRRIEIHGSIYAAQNLVWMYVHGTMPKLIDHINGNPDDNRIENLREATYQQNSANSRIGSSNTSGAKGVRVTPDGRFKAVVCVRGVCHDLGTYETLDDAKAAYLAGATKHFGDFATNGERPAPVRTKKKAGPLSTEWIRNGGRNETVTPMCPGQKPSTLHNVPKRILNKILAPERFKEKRDKAIASAIKSLPETLRERAKKEALD